MYGTSRTRLPLKQPIYHCFEFIRESFWGKPSLQLGTLLGSGNLKQQPPEEFEKKVVLKNFATFTVKQLYRSVFFNKPAGIRRNIENFVDFSKFLRAPFRENLHTIVSEFAEKLGLLHCVKGVRIWRFSGPYFPAFGLEKLQIQTLFTQYYLYFLKQNILSVRTNLQVFSIALADFRMKIIFKIIHPFPLQKRNPRSLC